MKYISWWYIQKTSIVVFYTLYTMAMNVASAPLSCSNPGSAPAQAPPEPLAPRLGTWRGAALARLEPKPAWLQWHRLLRCVLLSACLETSLAASYTSLESTVLTPCLHSCQTVWTACQALELFLLRVMALRFVLGLVAWEEMLRRENSMRCLLHPGIFVTLS